MSVRSADEAAAAPARRRKWLSAGAFAVAKSGAENVGFAAAGLAIMLGAWWAAAQRLGPLRLPDPLVVAMAVIDNWKSIPALSYVIMQPGGLEDSLVYTTISVAITVSIGVALGIVIGLLVCFVAPLRTLVAPALLILGTIPVLILLPFLIQWFGNGWIVFSALVIVFTFTVITTVTMRSIDTAAGRYRDYARSLGAGAVFEMIHVAFPALVPDLVSGVRVSLAAAWSLQTVAELMGGKHGAGRIIGAMANLSNTTLVIAMVVCVGVTAVVIDGAFVFLAQRVQRWRP